MKPYSILASSYDYILKHVDYQEWYNFIRAVMIRFVPDAEVVVELGCGTGKFGAKFSNDGYRIYGIDRSVDMLMVAKMRAYKNFRIFCADMRAFTLAKNADFIFAVHDTMNYLTEKDDLHKVFRSVKKAMHDRSVFLFDITTEYNIEKNFENKTARYEFMERGIRWSNDFDRGNRLVYSRLSFIDNSGNSAEELHVQRIYTVQDIEELLRDEGFTVLGIYGDSSFDYPGKESVMINFVVRR